MYTATKSAIMEALQKSIEHVKNDAKNVAPFATIANTTTTVNNTISNNDILISFATIASTAATVRDTLSADSKDVLISNKVTPSATAEKTIDNEYNSNDISNTKLKKSHANNKLKKKKKSKKIKNEIIQQKNRLYKFVDRYNTTHNDTAGTVSRLSVEQMHGGRVLDGENLYRKEEDSICISKKSINSGDKNILQQLYTLPQIISKKRICTRLRARREFEKALLQLFPSLERRWPSVGGTQVDFLSLYCMVTKDGGFKKFHSLRKWQKYCKKFNVPATCTSSGNHLANQYLKYLMPIEEMFENWCEEHEIDWKKYVEISKSNLVKLKDIEKNYFQVIEI